MDRTATTSTRWAPQRWQVAVSAAVFAYLALGVATGTLRPFHWWMLLLIPVSFLFGEACRSFLVDWAPMVAFWLVYDRLRLVQPLLLDRVAIQWPFELERWLFGGLCRGDVPAHAARAWLAAHSGTVAGAALSWTAQVVYLSHIGLVPVLLVWWWIQGGKDGAKRRRFRRMMLAFSYLNFAAIFIYVLLPVAPPWWVSLQGMAQPTSELVAGAKLGGAMEGRLVLGLIQNAAQWFAAFPSLHGAYPVLLAFGAWRARRRRIWFAAATMYAFTMWAATVVLNQHYIIDLMAGGLLAGLAWFASGFRNRTTGSNDCGSAGNED